MVNNILQALDDRLFLLFLLFDFFLLSFSAATAALRDAAEMLAAAGKTPLYFAEGQQLLGVIAVADVVKPDSAAAIAALPGVLRVRVLHQ